MSDFLTRLAQRGAGIPAPVLVSPGVRRMDGAEPSRRAESDGAVEDAPATAVHETAAADGRHGLAMPSAAPEQAMPDASAAVHPRTSTGSTHDVGLESTRSAVANARPLPPARVVPRVGVDVDAGHAAAPRATAAHSIEPDTSRGLDMPAAAATVGPAELVALDQPMPDVAVRVVDARPMHGTPHPDPHPADTPRRSRPFEVADDASAGDAGRNIESGHGRDPLMPRARPVDLEPASVPRALPSVPVERESTSDQVEVHIGRIEVKVAAPPATQPARERPGAGFERYRSVRRHTDRNWY